MTDDEFLICKDDLKYCFYKISVVFYTVNLCIYDLFHILLSM